MTVNAADLFAGLGGFSEGARQAGVRVDYFANHWPEAVEWHTKNHPHAVGKCQDVQTLDLGTLPDLSRGILLAAPACQGNSQCGQPAGKGTGGSHAPDPAKLHRKHRRDRETAWSVIAAVEWAMPAAFVIENVPDITWKWPAYEAWLSAFRAMGYALCPQVLNALDFGGAQDRARFILTGTRHGEPIEIAPSGVRPGTIGDCLDPWDFEGHRWAPIESKPERSQKVIQRAMDQAGPLCFVNNVSESIGRTFDMPFPTVTTQSGTQFYIVDGERGRVRIVNPRELARAQGFGEDYLLPRQRGLAGKLIGNAIHVKKARAVVSQVAEAL